jgi:hypothetical protein
VRSTFDRRYPVYALRRSRPARALGLAVACALAPTAARAQEGCPLDRAGCHTVDVDLEHREAFFDDVMLDSGRVPAGSPRQVRFALFLGGSTEVDLGGRAVTSWPPPLDARIPGRPSTGRLAMNYGLEIVAMIRIDVEVAGGRGPLVTDGWETSRSRDVEARAGPGRHRGGAPARGRSDRRTVPDSGNRQWPRGGRRERARGGLPNGPDRGPRRPRRLRFARPLLTAEYGDARPFGSSCGSRSVDESPIAPRPMRAHVRRRRSSPCSRTTLRSPRGWTRLDGGARSVRSTALQRARVGPRQAERRRRRRGRSGGLGGGSGSAGCACRTAPSPRGGRGAARHACSARRRGGGAGGEPIGNHERLRAAPPPSAAITNDTHRNFATASPIRCRPRRMLSMEVA